MCAQKVTHEQYLSNAFQAWLDEARSVKLEKELERRGVKGLITHGEKGFGPCPRCGGEDRFSFNTKKQLWNCRGCRRGGDIIDLVANIEGVNSLEACRKLTGRAPPGSEGSASGTSATKHDPETRQETRQARADSKREAAEYERRQHEKATRLWSKRRPIVGSLAERYLREVRGISCRLPATLAFLPALKRHHHPAMIAAFGIPDEPEPGVLGEPRAVNAVHLTLLKPDGSGKADVRPNKLIIARPLGRPIVLTPPNDLLGLGISEGIEDGLTAHAATGLGVWAAGSGPMMPALADAVPDYIEAITIFAHDDKTGQRDARALADALHHRGSEIRIEELPP